MKVTIPLRQQEFKLKIVKTVLHKNNNASSKTISPHCDGWIQHDDGNKENRSMANKKTNPFPFGTFFMSTLVYGTFDKLLPFFRMYQNMLLVYPREFKLFLKR